MALIVGILPHIHLYESDIRPEEHGTTDPSIEGGSSDLDLVNAVAHDSLPQDAAVICALQHQIVEQSLGVRLRSGCSQLDLDV